MAVETSGASGAVEALLAARKAENSRPGARTDEARLVLLIEGGSSRGAFSSGMTLAFEELGLLECFDAVYGSSAGALNAAWLLCGRARQSVRAWWDPEVMYKVIDPRRALRGSPVVDTRHLVHHVYEHVFPMGFAQILASPVTFHPLATDALTGRSTDLHPYLTDVPTLQLALRATTCLPILAGPPITIGTARYLDAGVAESVPIHTALAQGATHIVCLRTRREDEAVTPPGALERRIVGRYLSRQAPGALDVWLSRQQRRALEEQALAAHPSVLQIRPPADASALGRVERDPTVLRRAVDDGRAQAMAALERILPDAVTANTGGAPYEAPGRA